MQKVPLRIFKIAYPAESQAAPTYPQLSVLNGSEDYQLNCSLKILSTAPSAHPYPRYENKWRSAIREQGRSCLTCRLWINLSWLTFSFILDM